MSKLKRLGAVAGSIAATMGLIHGQEAPRLSTRWAATVDADRPHPEYPRPQLERVEWLNLNGVWDFGIAASPTFGDRIVVPFPIESALSGVAKPLGPKDRAHYRRKFRVPAAWRDRRVLLHFGAVDWEAQVHVNGTYVGGHRGGFDPFSFDITHALRPGEEQEVVVEVTDPTDTGEQPRGKQVLKPSGIYYTPSSGIWQTVWIEPVAEASLESLHVVPDVSAGVVRIRPALRGGGAAKVWAEVREGDRTIARVEQTPGQELVLKVPRAKLWSPDRPFLYGLRVGVIDTSGRESDSVRSYFGMRSIAIGPDPRGVTRLLLNGKPLFQIGLLDQGFWPDGLLTAPTDEALLFDLEVTKRLGFNLVRKHVKVEPARWYYHCDRLGLLVWQDMPSGERSIGSRDPDMARTGPSAATYEVELTRMIRALSHFPSIVMWVVFNEGWGQFDTARIAALTRQFDPSRLVNAASGWTDRGVGDVVDMHLYPGPSAPPAEPGRAAVLGEFGGLGLPVPGHMWVKDNNWGYRTYQTSDDLTEGLVNSIRALRPLISAGLSAAVYTQTTDVETEVNGLLTYDRAQLKADEPVLRRAIASVFRPYPRPTVILPTSETSAVRWRYTTEDPGAGWEQIPFDDARWREGEAGFGTPETPGAIVRTRWDTDHIWLRRRFRVDDVVKLHDPHLRIHHDEDVEVYLDGKLIFRRAGYTVSYLEIPISRVALRELAAGEHTLAVRCRQTQGGQYIDLGLVDLPPAR